MKAILGFALAALFLAISPFRASAQDDCSAVRQTRAFAQSQGLDSGDLERLERRACRPVRRGRHERRARRAQRAHRAQRDTRDHRESNDSEACQTLTLMESFAALAGDEVAAAEVVGARRAVCREDYGEGTLRWANGSYLRTSGGTYYWPNGAYARTSGGTYYYPSGNYARTANDTWYYPSGTYAKAGRRYYSVSGSRFDSAQSAMLYACQRMPDACRRPRRGDGASADASVLSMLWPAG